MKSKSKFFIGALCMAMICATSVIVKADTHFYGDVSSVTVDGKAVDFREAPEIVEGRTFVPMRAIFEALGAKVDWNDKRKEAVATIGESSVVLKIGSKVGLHDITAENLDAAPYIKGDRTMVPLRYLSESLGYKVDWNEAVRTVSILSSNNEDNMENPSKDMEKSKELKEGNKVGKTKKDSDTKNRSENKKLGDNKKSGDSKKPLAAKAVGINGKPTKLTYKEAQNRIVKYSPNMDTVKMSYEQAKQSRKEFLDQMGNEWTETQLQTREDLNLAKDWAEKMVILTGQQQAYSITTKMNDISIKLAELKQAKFQLKLKEKDLEAVKTQYELGALSKNKITTAENEVKAASINVDNIKASLEGLYISLYNSLDYKLENYEEPEFKLNYKKIGNVDLDEKYRHEVNNDPYIRYLINGEKNAEFKFEAYEFNNPMSEKSYEMTYLSVRQAGLNLSNTKNALKNAIYSRYNSIIQLETSLASLYASLDSMRDQIDSLRSQYEYGAISRLQLEKALENESEIKLNILKSKIQHQQMMEIFEKPYLAPDYMVGA